MTLLFIEGFETYATKDDLYQKWNSASISAIGSAYGRNCSGVEIKNGSYLQKAIPLNDDLWVGFAFKMTT